MYPCLKWVFVFLFIPFSIFSWEVLTLGDSIVDHIIQIEDSYLTHISGKKGGSELVDKQTFASIVHNSGKTAIQRAGGSAVNMVKGLSHLGHSCAVLGTIGEDEESDFFIQSLLNHRVTPLFKKVALSTGRSVCLITPDHERTMRTFLGASSAVEDLVLSDNLFEHVKLFHVEAYQLRNLNLLKKTLLLARQAKAKVSIDLGCFELMQKHKQLVLDLLPTNFHIVFANQDEAFVLTGENAQQACKQLATLCEVAVVTMGEKGGWVCKGNECFSFSAFPSHAIDATGAGDLFVSGFLHGYLNHFPLKECARLGAIVASKVVEVVGAELPEEKWKEIFALINTGF